MTEQTEQSAEMNSMANVLAAIKGILSEEDEKVDAIDAQEAKENKEKAFISVKDFEDPAAKVRDPEPEIEEKPAEKVVELTADMAVEEDEEKPVEKTEESVVEEKKEEAKVEDKKPVVEEDEEDYKPVPVIPAEEVVEEDLSDLMKEQPEENTVVVDDGDSLMSGSAIEAATHSLSALQSLADDNKLSLGHGGLTIEIIVRETLKPLLREWLNKNLPPIVERIVKKEVAHIIDRLNIK